MSRKAEPAMTEIDARPALIQKLQRMTVANGCTPAEAASARRRKRRLLKQNSRVFLTGGARAPKTKPRPKPRRWTGDPTRPHEALQTVATAIMAVPEANREQFSKQINRTMYYILLVFVSEQAVRKAHDRQALKRVARAAEKLDAAVKQLTVGATILLHFESGFLDIEKWREQRGDPPIDEREITEADYYKYSTRSASEFNDLLTFGARALKLASGAIKYIGPKPGLKLAREAVLEAVSIGPTPRRGARGRPTGATNDLAHRLAVGLIRAAMDCGGKITVYPKTATGTLVEAQECLRVLLPAGFKVYSPASLKRILKDEEERRRQQEERRRGTNKSK